VKRVDDGLLVHDVCEGIGIWSLCAADLIKYWQVIGRPWEISTETGGWRRCNSFLAG